MMGENMPLTAADCDLTDFAFMPLDVARLRDSELASNESPESCWAAVLLWAASWHQIPAASIPNDEKWIAKHAGYAQRGKIDRAWNEVRAGALRGWIECTDGRLYHPVVAEKAVEAWKAKIEQRWRSECARIKKHNQRHGTHIPFMQFDEWVSAGRPLGQSLAVPGDNDDKNQDNGGDNGSKRQGEGQGQGDSNSVPYGTGVPPVEENEKSKSPEEMTKAELWRAGKSLLSVQGMPEAQCGTFVGKLCKDYGDEVVIEAVRSAVVKQPADAASFLKAACMAAKKEGGKSLIAWYATDAGVVAKGLSLDPPIKTLPGEYPLQFKARVIAAVENGGKTPVVAAQPMTVMPPVSTSKPPAGLLDQLKKQTKARTSA